VQLVALIGEDLNTMVFVYPWMEKALFVTVFVAIWFVSFILRRSYLKRSNHLRATRSRVALQTMGVDPYPGPGDDEAGYGRLTWGPSILLLAIISIMSIWGIVAALFVE